MSSRARRCLMLAAGAAASACFAGCAAASEQALRTSLAAIDTATPKVSPPASSSAAPNCGDPTASLRPPAALPAPQQMPPGSFMRAIQSRGRLIAGVNQNYLLFGFLNPFSGQIEGFEIDLLRQVAKAILGDPTAIEFRALSVPQRIPFVQQGSVDIVADAVTINCARLPLVSFSTVYYDAGQRVLVPKNSAVRSLPDLAHKRVCVTKGSTADRQLELEPSHPIRVGVAQGTDCMVALQEGSVDAVAADDSILLGYQAQDPYTRIVGPRFTDEPYGMAINRGHPEFVRFVNAVLERTRSDGTWAAAYAKWIGRVSPGRQPAPPKPRYRD